MSATPFGDHLKREREMRGVSLEEIATATRISTRFLEALEKEQWTELPGGVFNRGFIRSVSRYLGLDEDDMVAEYAMDTEPGQKASAAQAALHVAPHPNNGHARPLAALRADAKSGWPRKSRIAAALVSLSVLGLIVAAGWFIGEQFGPSIWQRLRPSSSAAASPAQIAPSAAVSRVDPSMVPAPSREAAPPANPPATSADALDLKIEAGKPAHVQVFADGKNVFDGEMDAGSAKNFQAQDNFQVTASEASALLLALNSRQMPPIGAAGHPGTIMLSRKDLPSPSAGGGPH